MSLQLDCPETTALIDRCVRSVEWPCFSQCRESNEMIRDILMGRQDHVLKTLSYYYLPTKPMMRPAARDGHAATSFPETNHERVYFGKKHEKWYSKRCVDVRFDSSNVRKNEGYPRKYT